MGDAAGGGPDLDAAVAALLTETTLTLPDLASLTDRQIWHLYYHPRDRDGRVVPGRAAAVGAEVFPGKGEVASELDAARNHFRLGKALGVPRAELERSWLAKHDTIPEGV